MKLLDKVLVNSILERSIFELLKKLFVNQSYI